MLDEGCTYCGLASGSTLVTLLQIEGFFWTPAEVPEFDFWDFSLEVEC